MRVEGWGCIPEPAGRGAPLPFRLLEETPRPPPVERTWHINDSTHIHISTYIYIYIYICIYIYIYMYKSIYIYIHTYNTYICIYIYICIYTHVDMHTYIHIYMCIWEAPLPFRLLEEMPPPPPGERTYLTECTHRLASINKLPHEIINLLFLITYQNIKLTCGHCGKFWYLVAEKPAPAAHLAHPEGCAALRIVLVTAPCLPLLQAFSG